MNFWVANGIGLALLAWNGWRGWQKGLLRAIIGVVRIICAYWGAFLLAGPLGRLLQGVFGGIWMIAALAGGLAVFLVMYLLFEIIEYSLNRIFKIRREERGGLGWAGKAGRPFGALLSLLVGVIWIIVVFWIYALFRGTPQGEFLPDASESYPAHVSRWSIQHSLTPIFKRRLEPAAAENMATVLASPDIAMQELHRLFQLDSMQELWGDGDFWWGDVLSGEQEHIKANSKYRAVCKEPGAIDALKKLGLVAEKAEARDVYESMAGTLARAGAKLSALWQEPAFKDDIDALKEEWPIPFKELLFDRRALRLMDRLLQPGGKLPEPAVEAQSEVDEEIEEGEENEA